MNGSTVGDSRGTFIRRSVVGCPVAKMNEGSIVGDSVGSFVDIILGNTEGVVEGTFVDGLPVRTFEGFVDGTNTTGGAVGNVVGPFEGDFVGGNVGDRRGASDG